MCTNTELYYEITKQITTPFNFYFFYILKINTFWAYLNSILLATIFYFAYFIFPVLSANVTPQYLQITRIYFALTLTAMHSFSYLATLLFAWHFSRESFKIVLSWSSRGRRNPPLPGCASPLGWCWGHYMTPEVSPKSGRTFFF